VPLANPQKHVAQIVFSENLEPDSGELLEKIAHAKVYLHDQNGKSTPLAWHKGEKSYLLSATPPAMLSATCNYGVLQRKESDPFFLVYHAKATVGKGRQASAADLPLDIVHGKKPGSFQVVWQGRGLGEAEVSILGPRSDKPVSQKTDERGFFSVAAQGRHGFRVRHVVREDGEYDGKKYKEVRHYFTLVIETEASMTLTNVYPELPFGVSSFGAVETGGKIYVYGGHRGKAHEYTTETASGKFFRIAADRPEKWEELASGPAVQGLALVAHGGKVYRIGGMQPRNKPGEEADLVSLTDFACFDPGKGTWTELPPLPAGRSSHDAVVIGDAIFVVGGWNMRGKGQAQEWHDQALRYDLGQPGAKWEGIKQPFQRRALTASVAGGKMFVLGGMNAEGKLLLAVEIYDPVKDRWETGTALPEPSRNGFSAAAVAWSDRLYVSTGDGQVHMLDASKGWQPIGTLAQSRVVHRVVTDGKGRLVVLGGAGREGPVAQVEVLPVTAVRTQMQE
jgi:N-acetylneuraminic acid mutarotase